MDRHLRVLLVAVVVASAIYGAFITRYGYLAPTGRIRVDRWTGMRQVWDCRQIDVSVDPRLLRQPSPYDPIFALPSTAPSPTAPSKCEWVKR